MTATTPCIYVFFGMIATGKSTLALRFASHRGLAYVNTDVVRKELAGISPTQGRRDEVDQGIYTPEFSRLTYDALLDRAEAELRQGRGVVLDGSYQKREERERVVSLARRLGACVRFILCTCSDEVKKERLAVRERDPEAVSDGRWEVYLRQKERFMEPTELDSGELVVFDTDLPVDEAVARLDRLLP